MSEAKPAYIACANGVTAMTDCLVIQHGGLVRLMGHAQMDFTPTDAAALALNIAKTAKAVNASAVKLEEPENSLEMDVASLRSRVAMYLISGAGEAPARVLLNELSLLLMRAAQQAKGWQRLAQEITL
jgi:hypothetical protein